MLFILNLKELLGIQPYDSVVLYVFNVCLLAVIAISCFGNILIYLIVNYLLLQNEWILNKLNKYKFIVKMIKYYINSSFVFIIVEFIILIFSMSVIIQTSLRIIYCVV
jgi:hypothetical protein